MISNPVLQWILSALFVAIVLYAIVKTATSRTVVDRVSYGTHVLMGTAMFSMVWPWGMDLLLVPQIVVFGGATLWFAWLFLSRATHRDAADDHGDGHHSRAGVLAYHAGMMAAMVLMAVSMMQMGTADGSAAGGGHDMGSMPGMDMSDDAGGTMSMGFPLWVGLASAACAIAFGVAALYFTGNALASATSAERSSRPARTRTLEAVWNVLMAIGMAALFLPMASLG